MRRSKHYFNINKVFKPKFDYQDLVRMCERDWSEEGVSGSCWLYTTIYNERPTEKPKRIVFNSFAGAVSFLRKHGAPAHKVLYGDNALQKRFGVIYCAVGRRSRRAYCRVYRVNIELIDG